jgi:hypothetical protein
MPDAEASMRFNLSIVGTSKYLRTEVWRMEDEGVVKCVATADF